MSTTREYVSCADTAKLVRKALKQSFPSVKFSVRSHTYAGGASIDVKWTDGPLTEDVKAVTSLYSGATFDGMIDLKEYHSSLLADTDGNVREVRFGADFIFTNRDCSPARQAIYKRELERFVGHKLEADKPIDVSVAHCGELKGHLCRGAAQSWGEYPTTILHQMAARPWHGEPCPGGEGTYCPGCGRYQADHRAPHLH